MPETDFHYVYILQSASSRSRYYTGCTKDVQKRLDKHNSGQVPHTAKYPPWRVKTCIAFSDKRKAVAFERYLKSPSGRAFAKKRL
ncbi:MAG: GIY-YIG nuclease family protein [Chitinivibrionales bacterium]|nr:GIY-YIG nuclease family protein [Chitinivibrionales bacterium]MBD3395075.1 GIY-YIG nuclease family protein [Chitinivibrionales bacterium]